MKSHGEQRGEKENVHMYVCACMCVYLRSRIVGREGKRTPLLRLHRSLGQSPSRPAVADRNVTVPPAFGICTARADLPSKCEASVRRVCISARECVKSALYTESSAYLGDVVAVVTERTIVRTSSCRSASVSTCG